MRLLNVFVASLFSLTLFIACSSAPQEGVNLLSCKKFEQKMKETDAVQLVDVRTPEEFDGGTIGTAINIDFYSDDFKARIAKLDTERPLFIFCARGGRSGEASSICKELGFKTIYDLDGGYIAWSQYKR
ncbi:rhodanese-like domain-containing protein [Aureispira anguillae]|uniref:Rhodanese-like domain-containing protein n=1 Tax=Aureispira anguillae TaxID=2864201 RepID=A0A915YL57_9BACT|nr:rhodanese-like domain-containing protein [Aureispira anguillae]BDS15105.1 rhodanese-like domain-containing protein [Aureispira anguillae]